MIKLYTPVQINALDNPLSLNDKITVLGSCFADSIGSRLSAAGFDVCVNPFGTLYNPVSIANSISRLTSNVPFSESDCVQMGAGADLVCSFNHHTSFARPSKEEFLSNANAKLQAYSEHWKQSNVVIITLGTAWCFSHDGQVVSNCLKLPSSEFVRSMLDHVTVSKVLDSIIQHHPDKRFIFTVSPIRHLSDGANGNQLSKGTLLLSVNNMVVRGKCSYFPSYEIMMDELRDYRFYAEDLVHPSDIAIQIIWERFLDYAVSKTDRLKILENEKSFRRSQHRIMHP